MSLDFEDLLEVNRLRIVARIVSNAAHDINNALQVIGGNAEMLRLQSTLGAVEQRRVQAITTQAERIATTLACLSSITRSENGGRQIVDLTRVADDAVALRAFSLSRARITVTVDHPVDVSCVVSADRQLILQLFLNLLLNVETILLGRPEAAVQIRFERSEREWSVLFIDNGPGIAMGDRSWQARGAACPALGPGVSGVGLWLSARIAEQQGGSLEVADEPPSGAASGTTSGTSSGTSTGTSIRIRLPASG